MPVNLKRLRKTDFKIGYLTTVPGLASFHCLFGEFDSRYMFLVRNTGPNERTLLFFGRICEKLDSQGESDAW
jgi:hypothetical protein